MVALLPISSLKVKGEVKGLILLAKSRVLRAGESVPKPRQVSPEAVPLFGSLLPFLLWLVNFGSAARHLSHSLGSLKRWPSLLTDSLALVSSCHASSLAISAVHVLVVAAVGDAELGKTCVVHVLV